VPGHVHSDAAKGNALHAQPESLLSGIFPTQFDRAPGTDDAMPRQPVNLLQDTHDLARRAGPPSCAGHRSIARHCAPPQCPDTLHDTVPFILCCGRTLFHQNEFGNLVIGSIGNLQIVFVESGKLRVKVLKLPNYPITKLPNSLDYPITKLSNPHRERICVGC
jgi:hypothetical protein